MKKIYESLQIEVVAFDKKDVITASGSEHDNGFKSIGGLQSPAEQQIRETLERLKNNK